jgi:hypothetical protein
LWVGVGESCGIIFELRGAQAPERSETEHGSPQEKDIEGHAEQPAIALEGDRAYGVGVPSVPPAEASAPGLSRMRFL